MRGEDIHAKDLRRGEELGQVQGDLGWAAAGVEDLRLGAELVARDQRHFLRPDRLRLRREVAHHRLVRHLPLLRVGVLHAIPLSQLAPSPSRLSGNGMLIPLAGEMSKAVLGITNLVLSPGRALPRLVPMYRRRDVSK